MSSDQKPLADPFETEIKDTPAKEAGYVEKPIPPEQVDDELLDMATQEMIDAWERKDKKAILDSLRAICLSLME
jgi:hypothetical protein